MKKTLFVQQLTGFVFTGILGVLLHFLFEWANESIIVAPFSAVNESIWEHMKLLFFPMFVFSLIENQNIGKEYKNFWCVKMIGIVFGVLLIPVLYYTIRGIFGSIPDFVNIAIFFIASATTYILEGWLFKYESINCKSQKAAFIILCFIALLFALFTFYPPQIPLFEDMTTNTYGI